MDDKKLLLDDKDEIYIDPILDGQDDEKYESSFKTKKCTYTFAIIFMVMILVFVKINFHPTYLYEVVGPKDDTVTYKKCIPKIIPANETRLICVCNATYCDEFPSLGHIRSHEAVVYMTTYAGKRFEKTKVKFTKEKDDVDIKVTIDPSIQFQKIIGFGGAFTDATGVNWHRLSSKSKNNFIDSYFGKNGIGYTVGRVPIGGIDFSVREYSYDDVVDDFNLTHFKLQEEDLNYKIPMIRLAQEKAGRRLTLFANPWGAPGWVKTNGYIHGGYPLKGPTGGIYWQTWANYFVKFFEEYAKNNITFWGLTVQNEPNVATDKYPDLVFSAEQERDFLKLNLGPTIRKNQLTKKLKIMIQDTSRDVMPDFTFTILQDPDARKYTDGIAVHWYADDHTDPEILTQVRNKYPDKFIFYTESCSGCCGEGGGISLGSWSRGEDYILRIIQDLNHWATGWTDWNMNLDEHSGPNYAKNWVDSPIVVNNTIDEFYKQPMYYAMGHISKFITPGSRRIQLDFDQKTNLEGTAFASPENRYVLVLFNPNKAKDLTVSIGLSGKAEKLKLNLEKQSFTTVVWNKN